MHNATTQPAWSAYREPSFGHGRLTFNSATSAEWQWVRNGAEGGVVSDSVSITRNPACAPAVASKSSKRNRKQGGAKKSKASAKDSRP